MTQHLTRFDVLRRLAGLAVLAGLVVALAGLLSSAGAQDKDKKDDKKIDKKEDKDKKDDKDKKEEKKEPPKLDAPEQVLKDHKEWVQAVAYNHDGTRLATSGRDRTVKIWKDGKPIHTLKTQGEKAKGAQEVKSVVFLGSTGHVAAPSGKWNAKQQEWEGEIKIFDAAAGKELKSLPGHSALIESVAASADGKRLASASADKLIKIWDVENAKEIHTLKGHTAGVLAVAFSRDGKMLASAGEDSAVILWNAETGKEITILKAPRKEPEKKDDKTKDKKKDDKKKEDKKKDDLVRPSTSVAFSPDGSRLAAGNLDGTIRVWEAVANGKELLVLRNTDDAKKEEPQGVWAVAFSKDGKRLATGGYEGMIRIWDADTGALARKIVAYRSTVMSLAFSPDGQHLASAGKDPQGSENLVKIWTVGK